MPVAISPIPYGFQRQVTLWACALVMLTALLVLVGWGVYLGNAAAWLALPLFVVLLNQLQINGTT